MIRSFGVLMGGQASLKREVIATWHTILTGGREKRLTLTLTQIQSSLRLVRHSGQVSIESNDSNPSYKVNAHIIKLFSMARECFVGPSERRFVH
jgi:hypothetical protein